MVLPTFKSSFDAICNTTLLLAAAYPFIFILPFIGLMGGMTPPVMSISGSLPVAIMAICGTWVAVGLDTTVRFMVAPGSPSTYGVMELGVMVKGKSTDSSIR